jgi:hypothetical protein
VLAMGFFHFMQGFLSSGTLGFHCTKNNPAAHTPKINWKIDEIKALDILTLISFAHKYLDECHKVPRG